MGLDDQDREYLLRTAVANRKQKRHEGRDDSRTKDLLRAEIERLNPRDTLEQKIPWYGHRWAAKKYWHPATKERLEALAGRLGSPDDEGALSITRSQVFAHQDPVDLFLAAMAWGYGTNGYGAWRTAEIVNPDGRDGEAAVRNAVGVYRESWNPSQPEGLLRAWAGGRGKIHGLGPAFASKVAYFALYDPKKGIGPLIADRNTTWSVWALGGIWDSRYTGADYAAYIRWCERWAKELGCRSHDVERALFNIGPQIRELYDKLTISTATDVAQLRVSADPLK